MVALNIKPTGPAIILIFIALYWMLGIGASCAEVASACVVVAVVVRRVVLLIHLNGLQGRALHGCHVGLGGWLL